MKIIVLVKHVPDAQFDRHLTGEGYTTVEMKINFVRPILPDLGEITCEGVLIHRGGTIATSEGRLRDGKGRLLAHGSETCMILQAKR